MERKLLRTIEGQLRQGEPTIEDMRWDIAEHEAMNMGTKLLMEILYHGMIAMYF